jgi:hypothetical protein
VKGGVVDVLRRVLYAYSLAAFNNDVTSSLKGLSVVVQPTCMRYLPIPAIGKISI